MELRTKVTAAAVLAALWVGVAAAQGAGDPHLAILTAAAAEHDAALGHAPEGGPAPAVAWTGGPVADASPATTAAGPSAPATTTPPGTAPPRSPTTAAGATRPGYSVAGGSTSSTSAVGQVYAESTQSGFGCQDALAYLQQHANPEFQLVCPGDAMGHQAMTCYYLQNICPGTAEIVIADPCPAAYENEAWNSWHMGSGPYDPYGWCSDWSPSGSGNSGQPVPASPTPEAPAVAAVASYNDTGSLAAGP